MILASRGLDHLNETAEEMRGYGAPTQVIQTDVTSEEQILSMFQSVMDEHGRLDILVNNSGVFDGGPLDQLPLETWNKVVAINLTAAFICTREAMKIMKPQGGGRIINIGSISSSIPRMNSAAYASTKHAIIGLTKSTSLEGREYGISAGAIHPGSTTLEWRGPEDPNATMSVDDIGVAALAMAVMPGDVTMLETTLLPIRQPFLGRG